MYKDKITKGAAGSCSHFFGIQIWRSAWWGAHCFLIMLAGVGCLCGVSTKLCATYDSSYVRNSGLKLWLRADSLALGDGASVDSWPDQSGSGNDAVQLNLGNRPVYVAGGVGGYPVVRFSRAMPSYMTVSGAGVASGYNSVFIVFKLKTGVFNPTILLDKYDAGGIGVLPTGFSLQLMSGAPAPVYQINAYSVSSAVIGGGVFNVLEGHYPVQSTCISVVLNGAESVSMSGFSPAPQIKENNKDLSIGGLVGGNGLEGDIAEVIMYGDVLDIDARHDIEAYLHAKYGVGAVPTLVRPVISVSTGSYADPQVVSISGPAGATIYYTLDGSDPTTASLVYSTALTVSSTTVIKAIAVKQYENNSPIAVSKVLINPFTNYVSRTGLLLWLSADTLVLGNGGSVDSWLDMSGGGNNAGQGSSGNRPSYIMSVSELHGMPSLHFNSGSLQYLSVADTVGLNPSQITMIAVARRATGTGISMIAEKGNGTVGYSLRFQSGTATTTTAAGYVNANGTITPTASPLTQGVQSGFNLIAATYDQAQNNLYVNGVLVDSNAYTAAITTSTNPLTIGGRGAANNLDGDIAEILVYNHALSSQDRRDLEAYVYAKYAVGSMPVSDTPIFSLNAGTYATAQVVSISTSLNGAAIYYTLDGSMPTTASLLYAGPIAISSTTTVRAIVVKQGYQNSPVKISNYTIDSSTSLVVRSGLQLWLKADSLGLANGSSVASWPDQSGQLNDAAQSVVADQPAYVASALNGAPVVHFNALATQYLAVPDAAGLKSSQVGVIAVVRRVSGTGLGMIAEKGNGSAGYCLRFQTATAAAAVVNNTGITAPTTAPLPLGSFNVVAQMFDQVQNRIYQNAALVMSGAYTAPITAYTNPLTIGGRGTSYSLDGDIAELLIYDHKPQDWELAKIYEYLYVKYQVGQRPTLPAPVFGKDEGVYVGAQSVSISSYAGAAIYYTTDGSNPTTASTLYSGPVSVVTTTTINAIAVKSPYFNSPVASVKLIITASGQDIGDGLPSSYNADSNGNGIPDSVETAMGLDPANTNNVVPTGENIFGYDQIHQITSGPGRTYSQDEEGNILGQ